MTIRRWLREHRGRLKRVATVLFVCVVLALLIRVGMTIEWDEVLQAIKKTPLSSLWVAGLLVAASYVVYSCFDLLGKWYTGHDLPWWRTMSVAFISS